ncbi:MAG: putative glycoside hydrolase, partial [bacterium]
MLLGLFAGLGAAFFLIFLPNEIDVQPGGALVDLPPLPEPAEPTSTPALAAQPAGAAADIEKQGQLPNPPEVIKGIYVTAWTAGSPAAVGRLIDFISRTELNAVVIDIKDFSGHVSYKTDIPEVETSGGEGELRLLRPNALIRKLHDAGIYVIARQTVFQDPILAEAHPEWALHNASQLTMTMADNNDDKKLSSSSLWRDNKGLSWMDPAARPVWDYNIAIAKDAWERGFDEINFDYIRFASDGDLEMIDYPFWDEITPRHTVIRNFFKYLRENLPNAKISADLFGLSTISAWDLGIGQIIEDAYEHFDYVSPMVYPSHYSAGAFGYEKPAEEPYGIVKNSLEGALRRLVVEKTITISTTTVATTTADTGTTITIQKTVTIPKFKATLRPWLQDFDLGAIYDAAKVIDQMRATEEILNASGTASRYGGWLLWDPANTYTEDALLPAA